jgi:ArsR family transcriptional regulator, arsenate/arsenite/antimonite-responsive transcriptional repressor
MRQEPSDIFKALSVETRVKIIELLKSKGPLGVNNIAKRIGVTPAAISQHLKILKLAGLVRNERKGYWIPYSLNEFALENFRQLLNKFCAVGYRNTVRTRRSPAGRNRLESLQKKEKKLKTEIKTVRKRIHAIRTKRIKWNIIPNSHSVPSELGTGTGYPKNRVKEVKKNGDQESSEKESDEESGEKEVTSSNGSKSEEWGLLLTPLFVYTDTNRRGSYPVFLGLRPREGGPESGKSRLAAPVAKSRSVSTASSTTGGPLRNDSGNPAPTGGKNHLVDARSFLEKKCIGFMIFWN